MSASGIPVNKGKLPTSLRFSNTKGGGGETLPGSDLTKIVGRGSLGRPGPRRRVPLDRQAVLPARPPASPPLPTRLRRGRARPCPKPEPQPESRRLPGGGAGRTPHSPARPAARQPGPRPIRPPAALRSPRRLRAPGRGRKCLHRGSRGSRGRDRRQGGVSRTSGRPRPSPARSRNLPPATG